jgi:hypothetical protein
VACARPPVTSDPAMNGRRARAGGLRCLAVAVAVAGAVAAAPAGVAAAMGQPPATPDSCTQRNGGDFGACNVGTSGRGSLPYLPVVPATYTVDDCIRINGGDVFACHFGSMGGLYPAADPGDSH